MITLPIRTDIDARSIVTEDFHPTTQAEWKELETIETTMIANNYLRMLKEQLDGNAEVRSVILFIRYAWGYEYQVLLAKNRDKEVVEYSWDSFHRDLRSYYEEASYDDTQLHLLSGHLDRLKLVQEEYRGTGIYVCLENSSFYLSYSATEKEQDLLREIGAAGLIDVFDPFTNQ